MIHGNRGADPRTARETGAARAAWFGLPHLWPDEGPDLQGQPDAAPSPRAIPIPMAEPAHFLATTCASPTPGTGALLGAAAGSALAGALGVLYPPFVPVATVAAVAACVWVLLLSALPRKVRLCLDGGRLLVDEGRGGAFPCAGAVVAQWNVPGLDLAAGTAIRFSDGARSYTIGAREYAAPRGAGVLLEVDAELDRAGLAAVLAHAVDPSSRTASGG